MRGSFQRYSLTPLKPIQPLPQRLLCRLTDFTMQTITGEQVLSSCRPDIYDTTTMSLSEICSQATGIKKYSTHISESLATNNTFHVDVLNGRTEIMEYLTAKAEMATKEGVDDPFFVMNIDQVFKCFMLWTKLFPTIRPFFAVKANTDPLLLSLFVSFGMGFDCASGEEIQQVLELGALPDSIVFAHPWKMSSHLRYAHEKNVSLMTFDHEEELLKINNDYKNARLLVRIEADDPNAMNKFGEKFGCSVPEACTLVQTAKQLNLNIVGVCFHVGLGSKNPDSFRKAIASSHEIFQYAESIGCHLTILDIGGGYPGTEEEFSLLEEISKTVNSAIAEFFSDRNDLTVIAEPGQFFSRSIFSVVVQVTGRKKIPNEDKISYYINEGIFGTFLIPERLSRIIELEPLKSHNILKDTTNLIQHYPSVIWGPTLTTLDKVCETSLPELHTGDWLVCKDMGAYSLSTNFCGFSKPRISYFTANL